MPTRREALTSGRSDVVVVGGGIHGLFAAYDAASRGFSVTLLERDDFGSGLSFNHQRTIHGGLRALEQGDLRKVRDQLDERRTWVRIAPHLLRVLPFATGTYRFSKRSKPLLRAAFALYDSLGRSRNDDVVADLHLPPAHVEGVETMTARFPGIAADGLTGGAVWYDYQTRHPDRLNWLVALAAIRAGATLRNYTEVIGPLRTGGRIGGVKCRDAFSGHEIALEAGAIVLAAGSGLSGLHQAFGVTGAPALLYAANLLVDRRADDFALASTGRSRRMLTAVPWRGLTLVGTFQSRDVVRSEPERQQLTLEGMLDDANSAFPRLSARLSDIRMWHQGLTPALERHGRARLLPESRVIEHGRREPAASGVFSLIGVKFTTARRAAQSAIDVVATHLRRGNIASRTASALLPFAGPVAGDVHVQVASHGLDADVSRHLIDWYGGEAPAVAAYATRTGLVDRLGPSNVVAGEIAYAAEYAQAHRLVDAVLRRTALGSAGHPGAPAVVRAADVMGQVHGWNDEARAAEIAALEHSYPDHPISARTP